MIEKKIQLWTDETFSQFAISFNSQIIVKTDDNVSYTNMIDETSYVTGYDINWHYTLAQWVIYYFSDKYIARVKSRVTSLEHLSLKLATIQDLSVE